VKDICVGLLFTYSLGIFY